MSTWLKGLRYGNGWFELIEAPAYYLHTQQAIDRILGLVLTEVKVACLKESPDVILGYAVYTGPHLHWVFCKKAWRQIGICKSLIPKNITTVTHITDVGKSLLKKHPQVKFNPFV